MQNNRPRSTEQPADLFRPLSIEPDANARLARRLARLDALIADLAQRGLGRQALTAKTYRDELADQSRRAS